MATTNDQVRRIARFRSVVISRYDDGSWREQAACRDVETQLFFPVGTSPRSQEVVDVAKSICSSCPVQVACLKFAIVTNQEYGVWGGHDEEERRILRRKWRNLGTPIELLADDKTQPAAS
ncbi:MAG: WhiB family transcriptional regulator [Acidobacteriota bacterium]|jgi:WhiB family redox-sensing transcriptional regulator|nr:WhiB family transcriptional regulator [Acidobacteriota bacterium]